ncbi:MAG: NADH pyrophosphatase [bacterium]|nr:NADH pyrophosphatase [bacterium]
MSSPGQVNGKTGNQSCSKCGFVHYQNPKPCVGAVILQNGKVLLVRRANEPFKNHWDFPGGFLECGERAEDGLKREVGEELTVGVKIIRVLGIYPDTYGPGGEATLNIYYYCKILPGNIVPQIEIAEAEWFAINALPAPLAFGHVKLVLNTLK